VHSITLADGPWLYHARIDPAQVKLLAHGRIDEQHGVLAKACYKLLAARVRLGRYFDYR
jgi:hypothetical protein